MKPTKPFAWSYTALTGFENCPHRHWRAKVVKDIADPPGDAALFGQRAHKALENRVKNKTPLPESMKHYEPYCKRFEGVPGQVIVEHQIALTKQLKPTSWFAKDAWCRGVIDVGVVSGKKALMGDWKGLALDTKLPTPDGWTTMGEVQVGDTLFDSAGRQTKVVAKSDVHHRSCYKLTFEDTTSVVCDDEHQWVINGEVFSTQHLADNPPMNRKGRNYYVLTAKPLDLPEATDLLIHPYVLGAWLGDGKHSSGEICKPDEDLWDNIRAAGYEVGIDISGRAGGALCRTVYGLRTQLGKEGVLRNKHIPRKYLRGSYEQRLALLRGLMDTDGGVNEVRQQCVFTTCDKGLSDAVVDLLFSLGQRPNQATTSQTGFGKTVTAYPIAFKPLGGLNPFSMRRKANRVGAWGDGKSWRKRLKSIEPVDTVPTQCIAVDSPDHTFLCTDRYLVTHNTGKRKPDSEQMMLFAGLGFIAYPQVKVIDTTFIWLPDKKVDRETFRREDAADIWGAFLPRVKRMEMAYNDGPDAHPKKPSGLCNGYCPVKDCEFWTPRR